MDAQQFITLTTDREVKQKVAKPSQFFAPLTSFSTLRKYLYLFSLWHFSVCTRWSSSLLHVHLFKLYTETPFVSSPVKKRKLIFAVVVFVLWQKKHKLELLLSARTERQGSLRVKYMFSIQTSLLDSMQKKRACSESSFNFSHILFLFTFFTATCRQHDGERQAGYRNTKLNLCSSRTREIFFISFWSFVVTQFGVCVIWKWIIKSELTDNWAAREFYVCWVTFLASSIPHIDYYYYLLGSTNNSLFACWVNICFVIDLKAAISLQKNTENKSCKIAANTGNLRWLNKRKKI